MNEETFGSRIAISIHGQFSVGHSRAISPSSPRKTRFFFRSLSPVSRETPRQNRVRRNYPPSLPVSQRVTTFLFSFTSLSLSLAVIEVSCQNWRSARPDSNFLFLDRRQRETAHEILRGAKIYGRTRSSPFDQDPRKSPVPVPRGKMDRELGAMQRYIVSISSSRRPFGPSRSISLRVISIPYLVLLPRALLAPIRSYLMYDAPLRRRTFRSRRSFGIRRWPLATFVADLASSWDLAWEEI